MKIFILTTHTANYLEIQICCSDFFVILCYQLDQQTNKKIKIKKNQQGAKTQ